MKLSYNRQLGKYVLSHLGSVIESSDCLDDLLIRCGMVDDEPELEFTPFDETEGDDYDADLDRLLGDLR